MYSSLFDFQKWKDVFYVDHFASSASYIYKSVTDYGNTFSPYVHSLFNQWNPTTTKGPNLKTISLRTGGIKNGFTREEIIKISQTLLSLIGLGVTITCLYYTLDRINPTMKNKRLTRKRANELFKKLGMKKLPELTDYEASVALNLIDSKTLGEASVNCIGGLDHVLSEIELFVMNGLNQSASTVNLNSNLLKPPKGFLLYGPPGCGKTLLAKWIAVKADVKFLNLQISTLVNMWYGETQKYVEATFSLARKLQPCIIFIDEIDSFMTTRSHLDNEATRMMKTQFMSLWDGILNEDNLRILVIGATNRPQDIDSAILRRLSYKIHVPLPDFNQRTEILKVHLLNDCVSIHLDHMDIEEIAEKTEGFSGSDLAELCRVAMLHYVVQPHEPSVKLDITHFDFALNKIKRSALFMQ